MSRLYMHGIAAGQCIRQTLQPFVRVLRGASTAHPQFTTTVFPLISSLISSQSLALSPGIGCCGSLVSGVRMLQAFPSCPRGGGGGGSPDAMMPQPHHMTHTRINPPCLCRECRYVLIPVTVSPALAQRAMHCCEVWIVCALIMMPACRRKRRHHAPPGLSAEAIGCLPRPDDGGYPGPGLA